MKKIFKKIVIGSLVTSAILAILAILLEIDSEIGGKVLLSTMLVFPFSMAGLCCSSIYEKDNLKWLSIVGIAICTIGCLYYIGTIWEIFDLCILFCEEDTDLEWKIFGTFALLPASFAQISLLLSNNCETKEAKIIQKVTAILTTIIIILFLDEIWTELIEYNDFLSKLVAIIFILAAVGTILTRILSKPNKKVNIVKDVIDYNFMEDLNNEELKCPNCQNKVNPEWKYCPNCNNQLKEEPKEKQSA